MCFTIPHLSAHRAPNDHTEMDPNKQPTIDFEQFGSPACDNKNLQAMFEWMQSPTNFLSPRNLASPVYGPPLFHPSSARRGNLPQSPAFNLRDLDSLLSSPHFSVFTPPVAGVDLDDKLPFRFDTPARAAGEDAFNAVKKTGKQQAQINPLVALGARMPGLQDDEQQVLTGQTGCELRTLTLASWFMYHSTSTVLLGTVTFHLMVPLRYGSVFVFTQGLPRHCSAYE